MNNHSISYALLVVLLSASLSQAQGPIQAIRGTADSLSRLPDDQIEGTIWEYKAQLTQGEKKEIEDELVDWFEGQFRFEENAVFDAAARLKLPSKKKVNSFIESVKRGEPKEIRLPTGSNQKRIGQYRLTGKSKLRIDLDDPMSLNGVMVLRKKKGTSDVWQGSYQEKSGKRTVRKWKMEVRPIED